MLPRLKLVASRPESRTSKRASDDNTKCSTTCSTALNTLPTRYESTMQQFALLVTCRPAAADAIAELIAQQVSRALATDRTARES